jgi:cysteine dioxygenase
MAQASQNLDQPSLQWNWAEIGQLLRDPSRSAQEVFAAAGISEESLRPLCRLAHPFEPYGRRVLFSSPESEVMLATWTEAAECSPHDHGFSNGLVWLVTGRFIENHYFFDGSLRLIDSRAHNELSSIVSVDQRDIHSMYAPRGGISLHLYNPPIHKMKVYDSLNRRTLTVNDECGAWIPVDQKLIVDVNSWPNLQDANI